jgi:hypothetical protein
MNEHQMRNVGIGNKPDAPLKYVAELRFPKSETCPGHHMDLICTSKATFFATSTLDANELLYTAYPLATIESLRVL